MVFLTAIALARHCPIPDHFWKNRRLFRLTAHLYGRRRNCYRNAMNAFLHVLEDVMKGRQNKKGDLRELWETRVDAASREHGIDKDILLETLMRNKILLNRKVIMDLAIWEPRTFKALTDVAKKKAAEDCIEYKGQDKQNLDHIITKGLLRD